MARGPGPSWNKIETPIIQPVDEAESTSRQTHGFGSLTRSGRWIFFSGFEDDLNEFKVFTGMELTTTEVYQGKNASLLTTPATGEQGAYVSKYHNPNIGESVGLESMVSTQNGDKASYGLIIDLDTDHPFGRGIAAVRLFFDGATKKLQYAQGSILESGNSPVDGATWVDITEIIEISTVETSLYHNMKIVIDTEGRSYKYVILDGVKHMIAGDKAVASQPSRGNGNIFMFRTFVITHEAVLKTAVVDNFIITAETL